MSWLAKNPVLDGAVNFLNARAVTIYLWHNIAIAAIWPVLTVLTLDDLDILDGPVDLAASLALTMLAVLALGWVEDVAARRRPALWPPNARRRAAPEPEPAAAPAPRSGRTRSNGFGLEPDSVAASVATDDVPDASEPPADPHRTPSHRAADQSLPPWDTDGYYAPPPVLTGSHADGGSWTPDRDQAAPWSASGGPGATMPPVAPYPEAEVSFGLPEGGPRLRDGYGRPDAAPPRGHAAPAPAQTRRHDDEPAAAASWFGGDADDDR
jgi:hypothetical protein